MSLRSALVISLLSTVIAGCATLQPRPPGDPPGTDAAQGLSETPAYYPYRSQHCSSLKRSGHLWGLTSHGLAVVAGGMAAAGALPLAALLAGVSSAGLGIYSTTRTADYVRSCTTGNAADSADLSAAAKKSSGRPPPLTFSGVLTIVAGLLSAI